MNLFDSSMKSDPVKFSVLSIIWFLGNMDLKSDVISYTNLRNRSEAYKLLEHAY